MERGHWFCFFREGPAGEDDGRQLPLPRPLDEVTGDNTELVGSAGPALQPQAEEDDSRDVRSDSTSCSSCLCSYSGRQGAGAAVRGEDGGDDGDLQGGPRRGRDAVVVFDEDRVGISARNGGHRVGSVSSSEDEADSWRRVTAAAKTGRSSNSSCVVEFNRWDRPSSQPGYGWGGGFGRNDVPASAAGAADRAERDRAFWEACLASGYP